MLDAMAERMELAEALGVTTDELDRRSRYLQAHNPYDEDAYKAAQEGCAGDCTECWAHCPARA